MHGEVSFYLHEEEKHYTIGEEPMSHTVESMVRV